MQEIFSNFSTLIVFLHIFSAVVWIGGMIAIRIAVHPVISRGGLTPSQMLSTSKSTSMLTPEQRLNMILQIMGRLFNLVLPFIFAIIATGITMEIAMDGHHSTNRTLFITKEIIWTLMTINYGYMYYQRAKAWHLLESNNIKESKAKVALIPNLLLPINILLGSGALWIGVLLRGL